MIADECTCVSERIPFKTALTVPRITDWYRRWKIIRVDEQLLWFETFSAGHGARKTLQRHLPTVIIHVRTSILTINYRTSVAAFSSSYRVDGFSRPYVDIDPRRSTRTVARVLIVMHVNRGTTRPTFGVYTERSKPLGTRGSFVGLATRTRIGFVSEEALPRCTSAGRTFSETDTSVRRDAVHRPRMMHRWRTQISPRTFSPTDVSDGRRETRWKQRGKLDPTDVCGSVRRKYKW